MVKTCITCKHGYFGRATRYSERDWLCLRVATVDLVTGAKLYETCRKERTYDSFRLRCDKQGMFWDKKDLTA